MAKLRGQVFVGHVFNERYRDDLRPAIAQAFDELQFGFRLYYADDELAAGDLWQKIARRIRESFFCIFETSVTEKPNVFIELGYALACNKHCILLIEKGKEPPSDLAGFDRIAYGSMKQLTARLKTYLPGYLKPVIGEYIDQEVLEYKGKVDKRVIDVIGRRPGGIPVGRLQDELRGHGLKDDAISDSVQALRSLDFIVQEGETLRMTSSGERYMRELGLI